MSNKTILCSRSFNRVVYDNKHHSVIKTSRNVDKLINEINWYRSLPMVLHQYHPRIIRYSVKRNTAFLEYEFCPFKPLSEFFLEEYHYGQWERIVNHLMNMLLNFQQHKKIIPEASKQLRLYAMLVKKTWERLAPLQTQKPFCRFFYNSFIVNGIKIKPIRQYLNLLDPVFYQLFQQPTPDFCIIHGDFSLSNILYDLETDRIQLIDPRGEFGIAGIYGDIRYDLAKLRHSINGLYDAIIANRFTLKWNESTVDYQFDTSNNLENLQLDEEIENRGYNLIIVKYIEALLFLSMVPLHDESIEHQIVMLCQGAIKLEQVLIDLERKHRRN